MVRSPGLSGNLRRSLVVYCEAGVHVRPEEVRPVNRPSAASHRLTASAAARWAAFAPVLAALVLTVANSTPLGSHGALALVLAAAASALAVGAVGAVALLALVLLLAASTPRPTPAFAMVPLSRQQDPTNPGRPLPRAPGATSLPCAR